VGFIKRFGMFNFLKPKFPAEQFGYNVYHNSMLAFVNGAISSHETWLGKSVDSVKLGRGLSVAAVAAVQIPIIKNIKDSNVQDHIIGGVLRKVTEEHKNFAFDPVVSDLVNRHLEALLEDVRNQSTNAVYSKYASITLGNIADIDQGGPNWKRASEVVTQFADNIQASFNDALKKFNEYGGRLVA
jgi:hypothetical protein